MAVKDLRSKGRFIGPAAAGCIAGRLCVSALHLLHQLVPEGVTGGGDLRGAGSRRSRHSCVGEEVHWGGNQGKDRKLGGAGGEGGAAPPAASRHVSPRPPAVAPDWGWRAGVPGGEASCAAAERPLVETWSPCRPLLPPWRWSASLGPSHQRGPFGWWGAALRGTWCPAATEAVRFTACMLAVVACLGAHVLLSEEKARASRGLQQQGALMWRTQRQG